LIPLHVRKPAPRTANAEGFCFALRGPSQVLTKIAAG
jgi:hypothetical protein